MSESEEELFGIGDECPNCPAILCLDEIQEMKCFSCGCDLTNPEEWEDELDNDGQPDDDELSDENEIDL